jgi:hypothetical protein
MVSALKLVDPAASSLHFLPSGTLLRVQFDGKQSTARMDQ